MNLRVFVCIEVFDHARPVLLVAKQDGSLSFVCGGDHPDSADYFKAVGIGHVLADDDTVPDGSDLASDEAYERSDVNAEWVKKAIADI